jgi:hypothetical protein
MAPGRGDNTEGMAPITFTRATDNVSQYFKTRNGGWLLAVSCWLLVPSA